MVEIFTVMKTVQKSVCMQETTPSLNRYLRLPQFNTSTPPAVTLCALPAILRQTETEYWILFLPIIIPISDLCWK